MSTYDYCRNCGHERYTHGEVAKCCHGLEGGYAVCPCVKFEPFMKERWPRMTEIMAEIESDMTTVSSWPEQTDAILKNHGARAFSGHGAKFAFLVASFPILDQGFPKGSLGYDGTASRGSTVVRLTRELAEKAYKLAVGAS